MLTFPTLTALLTKSDTAALDAETYIKHAKTSFTALAPLILAARKPRLTFFFGPAGYFTLGAELAYLERDKDAFTKAVAGVLSFKKFTLNAAPKAIYYEILYGAAGFLYCLLDLQKKFQQNTTIPPDFTVKLEADILEVTEAIVNEGIRAYGQPIDFTKPLPTDFRLVYDFHGREYLGGAHGLCGVLYLLMRAYLMNTAFFTAKKPDFTAILLRTIRASLHLISVHQLPTGNFPSSFTKKERDALVQFCHGAPGAVACFILAAELFKPTDEKAAAGYLKSAILAGENIWTSGILKKGFGLCHGISGNGYAFLALHRHTKDPRWLYRAHKFVHLKHEKTVMDVINSYKMDDREVTGLSDAPFSLMLGLAGDVSYTIDVLDTGTASGFPGYEI